MRGARELLSAGHAAWALPRGAGLAPGQVVAPLGILLGHPGVVGAPWDPPPMATGHARRVLGYQDSPRTGAVLAGSALPHQTQGHQLPPARRAPHTTLYNLLIIIITTHVGYKRSGTIT